MDTDPGLIVASRAMTDLLSIADRAARSPAKVLITGESGVGKDVVAHFIHKQSPRKTAPFVAVNCAGLTETLLESELFGHVKGSFTGAYRDKRGKMQLAHRGTLFLDEVGEMSLRMQALLLRFLENGEIQAVGSDSPQSRVDVRVVAATNRNLTEHVAAGHFREDLLYRLRVIHLHVPPLRERPEDVEALARHFLSRAGREVKFTDEALLAFERYRWPGNVRELLNVVEQLIWLSPNGVIGIEHLPVSMRTATPHVMMPVGERRRQVADDLYGAVVRDGASFWEHVYPMFLARDITRHDLRELVRLGLRESRGRYKAMLTLFGMPASDYRRFMNFLAAHGCGIGVREFREAAASPVTPSEMPPVHSVPAEEPEEPAVLSF
ncbi:MAG TPA: sigma 54-interacting transcriptional regulator [Vicinamibacterales bacterium]|nr:sigma 54-interacting transcriptional regulator [Vicinamibacterales bacterium]